MIPISAVYIFSIKSRHSYHRTFPISSPIVPLYRLSIVSLYRHHCTFPIQIAYKIIYKGLLYFDIPNVSKKNLSCMQTRHIVMEAEGGCLERDMMILTGATQRTETASVSAVDVLATS